jgi:hypothetical protein
MSNLVARLQQKAVNRGEKGCGWFDEVWHKMNQSGSRIVTGKRNVEGWCQKYAGNVAILGECWMKTSGGWGLTQSVP